MTPFDPEAQTWIWRMRYEDLVVGQVARGVSTVRQDQDGVG